MANLVVLLQTDQPVGQRLAPEVREEINEVAPSTVNDGDVTTPKLRDGAVTEAKMAPGSVSRRTILPGAVGEANLDTGSVTTAKLDEQAVTPEKCAAGVVTAHNSDGSARPLDVVPIEAVDYAALTNPDPNTAYLVLSS